MTKRDFVDVIQKRYNLILNSYEINQRNLEGCILKLYLEKDFDLINIELNFYRVYDEQKIFKTIIDRLDRIFKTNENLIES